jgi:hypothetical protein
MKAFLGMEPTSANRAPLRLQRINISISPKKPSVPMGRD